MKGNVICYGLTRGRGWQQEWYETATGDARRRAKDLRKQGFQVVVSGMGTQVTGVGHVKMSLLTVQNLDHAAKVPAPAQLDRV